MSIAFHSGEAAAPVEDVARRLSPHELKRVQELFSAGDQLDQFAREYQFDNELEVLSAIGRSLAIPVLDLSKEDIDKSILEGFPVRLVHRHGVFPIARSKSSVQLVLSNPFDVQAADAVAEATGLFVKTALALPHEVATLIKSHLGVGAETLEGLMAQADEESGGLEVIGDLEFDESEAAAMAQQASVVQLVNDILVEAVNARASDIHMEVQESGLKLRYRIDGVLQTQPLPPEVNRFQAAIISRLKIMARLNIAEKRVPQDGRIRIRVSGREVDVRVSIIPMLHGEGVVMRVLDKDAMTFSLSGIGMEDDINARFQKLIRLPHGIVLVTGPTGSGKTTTLYSSLAEIKSERNKIITTEDPIEYQLEGINQIQVNHKVGLTFAAGLRSILRHDPDVVLVGEIRDFETAENAVQASLTGHMVFSTLHTNDAAGAFMRLVDMGVEPFLVASTVEGIVAQRLVRTLCRECREGYVPSYDEVPSDFPFDDIAYGEPIYRPVGCRNCRGTGYSGRLGIYELLETNEQIRQLAHDRTGTDKIRKAAIASGMITLRQDGWKKVAQGITSIDEVLRVTKAD
ncbi:MAG TPA: type II/IV secretion system protein [Planctomycetes bacterium]|nr:type II/IV secretion system protein [Fuerstiella sp.]HIK94990.1 type II/IV secretion system protein [Planctomycetota bacterium]